MIDTSVLVAGIAGFKAGRAPRSPSAVFLRGWLESATFTWLITEDILAEYKGVLRRLAQAAEKQVGMLSACPATYCKPLSCGVGQAFSLPSP